jgi:hypothetical protein
MRQKGMLTLTWFLAACGAPAPKQDPCEPNGHVHRSATEGDFCHCFEGYVATGISCEEDPNYAPLGPFAFGTSTATACWHAQNGPFDKGSGKLTSFKTVYTVKLEPSSADTFTGSVTFQAWKTGRFGVFLGPDVPVALFENLLPVKVEAQSAIETCTELKSQYGYSLLSKVDYRLEFGPTPHSQVQLMVDEVF